MSVDILMATYNGEKFIETQICSILAQTCKDWTLYIHDDGSYDDTAAIIRKYAALDKRIIFIEDGVTKLGPGGNFMHLLQFSHAPYICFCDQDDCWFENKLQTLYDCIALEPDALPVLVYSNAYTWFPEKKEPVGNVQIRHEIEGYKDLFFLNGGAPGCACIFNRALLMKAERSYENIAMHDQIISFIAFLFGKAVYLPSRLFLYRQHAQNTTAHIIQKKRQYLHHIFNQISVVEITYYQGVKAIYHAFADELDSEKKEVFEAYLSLPEKNFLQRILIVNKYKFRRYNSLVLLILKMMTKKFIG